MTSSWEKPLRIAFAVPERNCLRVITAKHFNFISVVHMSQCIHRTILVKRSRSRNVASYRPVSNVFNRIQR